MWRLAEMSDEISREGVHTGTAARTNVLFDINMHEALKLPLIWMKKHLESGSSIKGHTHRSCQNPGVRCVCYTAQSNWCYKRRNSVFLFLFNNFNDAFPPLRTEEHLDNHKPVSTPVTTHPRCQHICVHGFLGCFVSCIKSG